jgi:ABC-2 type transport system permease protein
MTALAYDTFWLGWRSLRRFLRVPSNAIGVIFYPIIQLFLFSQLFADIVQLPGFAGTHSYLTYLTPGQVVFTLFIATAWAASGLLLDMHTGFLEKLRVAPVRRGAILAGELAPLAFEAAAMGGVVLLVAWLLGAQIETGVTGAVAIIALGGLFGFAWAGISFAAALLTKSDQAAGTISMLFFPLAFTSTAFVPAQMMPGWMRVLNDLNPVTYVIEGMRSLMVGWEAGPVGAALLATAALALVTHVPAAWAFRRLTA